MKRCLSVLFIYVLTAASLVAAEFQPGALTLLSLRGAISSNQTLEKDQVVTQLPARYTTGDDSYVAIKLSNGLIVGASENSQFTVTLFEQHYFDVESVSNKREPSRSRLHITVEQGQISLLGKEPNPLSEFMITTAHGTLEVSAAYVVIQTDNKRTKVSLLDGVEGIISETDFPQMITFALQGGTHDFLQPGQHLVWTNNEAQFVDIGLIDENEYNKKMLLLNRAGAQVVFLKERLSNWEAARVPEPAMVNKLVPDNFYHIR